MEVHLSPDLVVRLNSLAAETGRAPEDLVQDAVASYVDDLADVRAALDARYDEIKSGKVQPIDGEQAFARLRAKNAARAPSSE